MALTLGLTASIRSRCAVITSRAETSRRRIAVASSRAGHQCSIVQLFLIRGLVAIACAAVCAV